MTRTYAARRLLELGPLTLPEFHAITGWERRACLRTLSTLCQSRQARRVRRGNRYMPSAYEVVR